MRYLMFIILLVCTVAVQGQSADRKGISDSCDKVMALIQAGKYRDAMFIVKHSSVMKEDGLDDLAVKMGDQLPKVGEVYGKIIGSQFVKDRAIGDFLIKRLYILRFEKFYLKFSFTLYKGSSGWTITTINYSEDLEEMY